MKDEGKTKEQRTKQLVEVRQRIAELQKIEAKRKRTDVVLWESRDPLRAVIESIPAIFFAKDLEGCFLMGNSVLLSLLRQVAHGRIVRQGRYCICTTRSLSKIFALVPCLSSLFISEIMNFLNIPGREKVDRTKLSPTLALKFELTEVKRNQHDANRAICTNMINN
jgi:hypothetical protein